MPVNMNRFGLSRNIPNDVMRKVRKRCGFGCVVCGSAIYNYEHFSPEFKDARTHDPDCIALLCPTDHLKKSRGLLSEEDYAHHIRTPAALEKGFAFTDWSADSFAPEILLGSFTFTGGTSILQIGDELLFGFTAPEEEGAPPGLIFRDFDRRGTESFTIIENEIRCQHAAFDIEAIGATWTIRSALRKIDLVIRFDPPTRITIDQIHFRYLRWELVVENGTLDLRFDGNPITIFQGRAKIHGPCLYKLAENEPRVMSSNMRITFGAGPAPIDTQPLPDGFCFSWPVYCPIDPADNILHIIDVENGQRILGLYTRKSFAEAACPDKFRILTLSQTQVSRFIEDYGTRNLIDFVAVNPTKSLTTASPWPDFMKNLEVEHPQVMKPIDKGHPLAQDLHNRPVAYKFPIYAFIKSEPHTPIQEIEVAVIHQADDLLPLFTEIEYAEAAKKVVVGDYRIQTFEKNGFIEFLQKLILPRKIESVVLNPELNSEEMQIIQTISVASIIADLTTGMTD